MIAGEANTVVLVLAGVGAAMVIAWFAVARFAPRLWRAHLRPIFGGAYCGIFIGVFWVLTEPVIALVLTLPVGLIAYFNVFTPSHRRGPLLVNEPEPPRRPQRMRLPRVHDVRQWSRQTYWTLRRASWKLRRFYLALRDAYWWVMGALAIVVPLGFVVFTLVTSPWSVGMTLRHLAAFRNCDAARVMGLAPSNRGEPGYYSWHDADGDGIACEAWSGDREWKRP